MPNTVEVIADAERETNVCVTYPSVEIPQKLSESFSDDVRRWFLRLVFPYYRRRVLRQIKELRAAKVQEL